ncbi:MAG: hypothetical protein PHV37_02710 [Candidatus Gastranaerophilales bacterium]|nr:hypothetical protein [Candidatus Gastranaerophilales bacterium]
MNTKKLVSTLLVLAFVGMNAPIVSAATIDETKIEPVAQTCETPSIIEHLPTYKGSSVNIVKVSSNSATVIANNVLKVTFTGNFSSKSAKDCDKISFVLNDGLKTVEGRTLLPCGTQIIGTIQQLQKPKCWNRSAKVYILFDEIVLPNCGRIPMCAKVYSKDQALRASKWKSFGKAAGITVAGFGVGAGLGAAIGTAGKASIGCLTYGMPIGAGVGAIVGSVTPGLQYTAKEGKPIYIQLVQDLTICNTGCTP